MESRTPDRASAAVAEPGAPVPARQLAELTRTRDEAIAAAAAERERSTVLLRQCDDLATEMFAWRRRWQREADDHAATRTRLEAEAGQLAASLAHARATIANMEHSWFWRMRLLSLRLRRVLK